MRPIKVKEHAPAALKAVLADGESWFLLGETEGPLCTKDQYARFAENPAHLFKDGRVMSYSQCIGQRADLEIGPDDGD